MADISEPITEKTAPRLMSSPRDRFSQADADLAAAEARDLAGLESLEALAHKRRLSAAQSRAERGAMAHLRVNPAGYREAAEHFGEAAGIVLPANSDAPPMQPR